MAWWIVCNNFGLLGRRQGSLHEGAERGDVDMVSLLLRASADVNAAAQGAYGDDELTYATPLTYAAMNGHGGVVAKLLEAGADVNSIVDW